MLIAEPVPGRRASNVAAAILSITLVLLAGTGCRPAGAPPTGLPALRLAEAVASAPPRASLSSSALPAAKRVVRRYYSTLDGLRQRMRTAPLARLLTADCPCQAQLEAVRTAARHGERVTDRVRIISLLAHLDRANLVDVVVSVDIDHGGLVDRAGHPIGTLVTLRNVHRELLLRRRDDRWLIARVIAV